MDHHLWTEALRPQRAAPVRAEVSEAVLGRGDCWLRQGGSVRLVSGPLAGCLGLLMSEAGCSPFLHIVRRWDDQEYAEAVN